MLARLQAMGVTEVHFHETGKLKAVAFGNAPPPETKEAPTEEPLAPERPNATGARRALEVLQGKRESLEDAPAPRRRAGA